MPKDSSNMPKNFGVFIATAQGLKHHEVGYDLGVYSSTDHTLSFGDGWGVGEEFDKFSTSLHCNLRYSLGED